MCIKGRRSREGAGGEYIGYKRKVVYKDELQKEGRVMCLISSKISNNLVFILSYFHY